MSKKLVLVALACGCLACAASFGCCHHGACRGGSCASGSCGHDYPAGPQYADAEGEYEQYADEGGESYPAAVTASRHGPGCKDGSCPY